MQQLPYNKTPQLNNNLIYIYIYNIKYIFLVKTKSILQNLLTQQECHQGIRPLHGKHLTCGLISVSGWDGWSHRALLQVEEIPLLFPPGEIHGIMWLRWRPKHKQPFPSGGGGTGGGVGGVDGWRRGVARGYRLWVCCLCRKWSLLWRRVFSHRRLVQSSPLWPGLLHQHWWKVFGGSGWRRRIEQFFPDFLPFYLKSRET